MRTPTYPALRAILLSCFIINARALPASYGYPQNDPNNPRLWAPAGGPVYPGNFVTYPVPASTGSPAPQNWHWPAGQDRPWVEPGAPVVPSGWVPDSPMTENVSQPPPMTRPQSQDPPPLAMPQPQHPPPSVAQLEAAAAADAAPSRPIPPIPEPSNPKWPRPATPYAPPPRRQETKEDWWHPYKAVNNGPQRQQSVSPFIPPEVVEAYGDEPGRDSNSGSSTSSAKSSRKAPQRGASTRKGPLQRGVSSAKVPKRSGSLKKHMAKAAGSSKGKQQQRGIRAKKAQLASTPDKTQRTPVPPAKASKKQGRKLRLAKRPPITPAKAGAQKPTRDSDAKRVQVGGKKATPGGASTRRKANVQKGGKSVK